MSNTEIILENSDIIMDAFKIENMSKCADITAI